MSNTSSKLSVVKNVILGTIMGAAVFAGLYFLLLLGYAEGMTM